MFYQRKPNMDYSCSNATTCGQPQVRLMLEEWCHISEKVRTKTRVKRAKIKYVKNFLKTTLFKNYFPIESKLLSERSEGGNLSGSMVPYIVESSNRPCYEAAASIERDSLRGTKEKT